MFETVADEILARAGIIVKEEGMFENANVAQVAHEANRAYCQTIGDNSQLPWDQAPEWQKESAVNGVVFHLKNPNAGPSGSHENWLKEKAENGWKYGPVKDAEKKEHPCFRPYNSLPIEQRVKDYIFCGIVKAFKESGI